MKVRWTRAEEFAWAYFRPAALIEVSAGLALLMPVIILGGILGGVFTATEAAAITAFSEPPTATARSFHSTHGRIDDLQTALQGIRSSEWRVTCSAHHNHQDTAEYQVVGLLWFDQHLRGEFAFPQTPAATWALKTAEGIPAFSVTPDAARPIVEVDIYYTQQGQMAGEKNATILPIPIDLIHQFATALNGK